MTTPSQHTCHTKPRTTLTGSTVLAATRLISSLLVVATLACTTRSLMRVDEFSRSVGEGQYLKGVKKIRKAQKLYGDLNRLLYYYDQGVLFHYAGEFDSSNAQLEKAEKVSDQLYARSVTNEAVALLTNDNLRPYRGRRYETILLHELMALNYLSKGLFDDALVESRKVQLAIDAFKDKDKGKDKYNDDGMCQYLSALAYGAQGMQDDADISLFKSVKAYQTGPIPLPDQVRNVAYYSLLKSQRDDDIKQLNLTPTLSADKVAELNSQRSEIILVGYAGKAPILDELVMWGDYVVDGVLVLHYRDPSSGNELTLPLPAPALPDIDEKGRRTDKVKSGSTFFVKFAIPVAVARPSRADHFGLSVDGTSDARSASLANTDLLLQQDLDDTKARTIGRTAIRVVLRTIAAQKAKQEMTKATNNALANLLLNVGTDVATSQMEKADTRLCFLLPRTIHMVRVPVEPGIHSVAARVYDGPGSQLSTRNWDNVEVKPGQKKFVFYPYLQ